ncbi:MAG: ATP-binding cassette domain-containing protein [Acidobacteriota bacterium]|nr:ATP-binding cassette domain-containing protein [Acidobacteriota bacterium]
MIQLTLDVTLRQQAFELRVRDASSVEVLGLFGPSGSGKTTLLEVIAGIRTPDAGEIRVGDRVLFSSSAGINLPPRDRQIGYVPQDALLFPHLDVDGNINYGVHHSRRNLAGDDESRLRSALVEILDLEPLLRRRVQKLSGGEKQRVAIARALMTQPAVLLLDEPLAGVDRARRDRILPYVLRIRRDLHVPLVYVTHDEAELTAIADRVLHLEAGQVTNVTVRSPEAAR